MDAGASAVTIALTEIPFDYPGGKSAADGWGIGSGAAVADVDADGDLDLFLARCDSDDPLGGPSVLLLNRGDNTLAFDAHDELATALSGTCAHSATFGDYDNDSHVDLFVANQGADFLFHNRGDGTFEDVTASAGVAGSDMGLETSAYWADINRDGLLDLLVPAHTPRGPPAPDPLNANRLYINRGDGTFDEIAAQAGIAGNGSTHAAAIADLDGDGDLEIYLANDGFKLDGAGPEYGLDPDRWHDVDTYDDSGHPRYTDRSADYQVDGPRSSMGVALSDVDGDGHDDLYVTDWGANHLQLWRPEQSRYEDVAESWGVALRHDLFGDHLVAWDALFTDFDHDGLLELLVAHGSVAAPFTCSSFVQFERLLERDPSTQLFIDITARIGWPTTNDCPPTTNTDGGPFSQRGILLADFDNDADDDLLFTPFIESYRLHRNDTPLGEHHVVRVEPRGTVSASLPFGALLEVTRLDGSVARRNLYAGGTSVQHRAILDVGLGRDDSVLGATLTWPSGYVQALDATPGFALDQHWVVTEPVWLDLSARSAGPGDPAPVLRYRPAAPNGAFLGPAAAGRDVRAERSDGVAVTLSDHGDGSYSAPLPHPGDARTSVVRIIDRGVVLGPRMTVTWRP